MPRSSSCAGVGTNGVRLRERAFSEPALQQLRAVQRTSGSREPREHPASLSPRRAAKLPASRDRSEALLPLPTFATARAESAPRPAKLAALARLLAQENGAPHPTFPAD